MYDKSNKDLQAILQPYLFVLKEGDEIHRDYLDFRLLMLKVSPPEVIPSPGSKRVYRLNPRRIYSMPINEPASPPADSF